MSTVLRGAVLGCGMIAEHHLRAWQRIPEVAIVALADRSLEAACSRRDAHVPEARVHPDLGALLREETLDFVDILTPPAFHAEHCRMARAAGLHIICQKPLTDDLASARALVQEMRGDRMFAVHENHRYRPWFASLLEQVRQGALGRISFVRIEQMDARAPAEAYKSNLTRAVLLEYGTHLLDMSRALLGEPRRVFARSHRVNDRVAGESLVHITCDHGEATAVVEAAWKDGGVPQGSLRVVGDRGEAYYEGTLTRGESARFRLVKDGRTVLDERRSPDADYAESFLALQQECVAAMLTGRRPTQTAEENLRTLAVTFAAYRSCDEGRVVDVSEVSP